MSSGRDIRAEVDTVFTTNWKTKVGQVVPDSDGVELGNHAVKLDGTILYADLADSTGLVTEYEDFLLLKFTRRTLPRRAELFARMAEKSPPSMEIG
jgi:hypothetical protein